MAEDNPTPLATKERLMQGSLAELVRNYTEQQDSRPLDEIMIEATRACETETTRRLAPFTVTETHRAQGVDPDELADFGDMPLDIVGAASRSYASALGITNLVRRFWLDQYAPVFQDMWTYSGMTIQVVRSLGDSGQLTPAEILTGPEPDTGMVWFQMGLYLPIGSMIRATYTGGYTTVPADLARACLWMAGAIVARELDPLADTLGHSPEQLEAVAIQWLSPWRRH